MDNTVIQSVFFDLLGAFSSPAPPPIPRHSLFYSYFICKSKEIHGAGFNECQVHTRQINACEKKGLYFSWQERVRLIYKEKYTFEYFCVLLHLNGIVHENINKILTIH